MRDPGLAADASLQRAVDLMAAKLVGPWCTGDAWTGADDLLSWKLRLVAGAGLLDGAPTLKAYLARCADRG